MWAQKYVAVCNQFEVLGALEDPRELWNTFKRETLIVTECFGDHSRSRSGVASREELENIEEGRAARLASNSNLYRTQ